MSFRKGYMATQAGDFNPGPVPEVDYPFQTFPFKYKVDESFLAPTEIYPVELSFDRVLEWLNRLKILRWTWSMTSDDIDIDPVFVDVTRNTNEETDLFLPGQDVTDTPTSPAIIFNKFSGTRTIPDFTGNPGDELIFSLDLYMFHLLDPDIQDRMIVSTGLFRPSIYFNGSISYAAGSEFSWHVANIPSFPTLTSVNTDLLLDLDGLPMGCEIDTGAPPNIVMTSAITPREWYPWNDSEGLNPKWDTATGAPNF